MIARHNDKFFICSRFSNTASYELWWYHTLHYILGEFLDAYLNCLRYHTYYHANASIDENTR